MKTINNNSSNAYKYDNYVNRTVISRKPQLQVIETEQKPVPSDKDMTLVETLIIYILVGGGFMINAYLFLNHLFQ
jgi:hypothetical protein